MSDGTKIEWTNIPGFVGSTWNPTRGCTKISPGCKHCYAEAFAERWRGVAGHPYEQGFDLRLVPEKLDEPLRARRPRAYFVDSMSDLHQDGVPHSFLRSVYAVMQAAPRHIFMVLTKRAGRMRDDIDTMIAERRLPAGPAAQERLLDGTAIDVPYLRGENSMPNVWLGVSVEDRKYGLPRVDVLRTIPAAVRFLSIEPLLEDLGDIDLTGIHWVIVGGESRRGARPFRPSWAYRILEQCRKHDVPFFMKQMGENAQADDGEGFPIRIRTRTRKGHDPADLPEDLRVREFPKVVQLCA